MSLYQRMLGLEEPKLSVHALMALMFEVNAGFVTAAQAQTALGLSAAEVTEVGVLRARIGSTGGRVPADEMHRVLLLADSRTHYDTEAKIKTRLGVA